jgi:hypothetical protein
MPKLWLGKIPLDQKPSPAKGISQHRIIWATLILGQLAFAIVVAVVLSQPGPQHNPPVSSLALVSAILLATVVPGSFYVRQLIFRKTREISGGKIPIATYIRGNFIFWACCESASFAGLCAAYINRTFWPSILVVAIAIALQVITMPTLRAISSTDATL